MPDDVHDPTSVFSRIWMVLKAFVTGMKILGFSIIALARSPSLLAFLFPTTVLSMFLVLLVTALRPEIAFPALLLVLGGTASVINSVIVDYTMDWADKTVERSLSKSIFETVKHPIQFCKTSCAAAGLIVLKFFEGFSYFLFPFVITAVQENTQNIWFGGLHERHFVFAYPLMFQNEDGLRTAMRRSDTIVGQDTKSQLGVVYGTSLISFIGFAASIIAPTMYVLVEGAAVDAVIDLSAQIALGVGIPLVVLATTGTAFLRGRFGMEHLRQSELDTDAPFTGLSLEHFQFFRMSSEIQNKYR